MLFRGFALSSSGGISAYALRNSLLVVIALCLPGMPVLGQEWEEPTEEDSKLIASDDATVVSFGFSVGVSGERVVVAGEASLSFWVFRFDADGEVWVEEETASVAPGLLTQPLAIP